MKACSPRKPLLSICWKLGITKEYCSHYHDCITNSSKTVENNHWLCSWILWVRNPDSVQHGQHGSASPCLGPPVEDLKAWGLFTPVSVVVLAVDWDLSWGLFLPPGFLTIWRLGFKGEYSKREPHLWTRLGNHTGTWTTSYWPRKLGSGRETDFTSWRRSVNITQKEEHVGMDMY